MRAEVLRKQILNSKALKKELRKYASPQRRARSLGFFKTGKGDYGEGDQFIGVTVPDTRKVARLFSEMNFTELGLLLSSPIHEERLAALLILVHRYKKGDEDVQEKVFHFYLKKIRYVNNWDLVDLSAHQIIGEHLLNEDKKLLYKLARSKSLWERRIAIVASYAFIRNQTYDDTLRISELLLTDREDLIHKAVGWMLREVGKRNEKVLENFLKHYASKMPRTSLRYAIERFPESKRRAYLLL